MDTTTLARAARHMAGVVGECHHAGRRMTALTMTPDKYLADGDKAADTYAEFLFRTSGLLRHEPAARTASPSVDTTPPGQGRAGLSADPCWRSWYVHITSDTTPPGQGRAGLSADPCWRSWYVHITSPMPRLARPGGAMDLIHGAKRVIVVIAHHQKMAAPAAPNAPFRSPVRPSWTASSPT